jgi:dihydroorotase/N-acyl-D-amino-acid deacylase
MLARLTDPEHHRSVATEIESTIAWRWEDVYISAVGFATNAAVGGRNLQQSARDRGCPPMDVLIHLIIEERGDVKMLSFNQSEENLRLSLTHPLAIAISDGYYVKGRPHPRLHGTFPLLLGTMRRKRNCSLSNRECKSYAAPGRTVQHARPGYARRRSLCRRHGLRCRRGG